MKTFPTANIRNVALVGHGGAGKTSLAEALLLVAGAIPRLGKVEDGTTVCDFDPEEQRRRISVSLALAPFELEGTKVNLLDTPGYADFVGDVGAALQAADLALFVVSAVEGVEVQTEIAWKLAEERGIPRAFFVNKLDRERASFERTLDQLKDRFGAGVAPLHLPIGEEAALSGVVDLLNDTAVTYSGDAPTGTEGAIPAEMESRGARGARRARRGHRHRRRRSDGALPRRREDRDRRARGRARRRHRDRHRVPGAVRQRDQAHRHRPARQVPRGGGARADAGDGAAAAIVFKTIVDSYVGRVNFFKVLQGTVKHDDVLANSRTKGDERVHQLFTMRGKEQDTVTEVAAGDIAAVAKLADTSTGDVLGTKGTTFEVEAVPPPEPVLAVAIKARSKGDEDKLANALHRLQDEDPVLRIERNPETHQTVLRGMGETHLSIALEKLARKFGVEVDTEDVRVAYRETITGKAEAEGKLKKQTGGHGQFAVAWLRVEPQPRGAGNEFVDAIVGGVIPRNFLPAVEKGVAEAEEHGGALGFPVVDVKITCFDGKHHPVDSSEMAFKTAASMGLRDALAKANPILLEPVSELVVTVPEANQGDIMGDLNGKRGRIQGSASVGGGEVEITANVPSSEILRYAIDLRSMTGGRGRFTARHSHYDPVPSHLVDKIVSSTKETEKVH